MKSRNLRLADDDASRITWLTAALRVARRYVAQGLADPTHQAEYLRRIVITVDRAIGVDAKNPVIKYPLVGDSIYGHKEAGGDDQTN